MIQLGQADELDCRLEIDFDLRKAVLIVNGVTVETTFSETFTSANYVGFRVDGAKMFFTKPALVIGD